MRRFYHTGRLWLFTVALLVAHAETTEYTQANDPTIALIVMKFNESVDVHLTEARVRQSSRHVFEIYVNDDREACQLARMLDPTRKEGQPACLPENNKATRIERNNQGQHRKPSSSKTKLDKEWIIAEGNTYGLNPEHQMDLRSEPAHGQPEGRPTTDSPKTREETLLRKGEHSPHGGLTRPSTSLPGGVESAELGVGSSQLQRVSRSALQIPDDVSNAQRHARRATPRPSSPGASAPTPTHHVDRA